MSVEVVPYDERWRDQFAVVADGLARLLRNVPTRGIERVGSTSVPGLAAKPVIDVDVVVDEPVVPLAVTALAVGGYVHRGDLGIPGATGLRWPRDSIRRNVYVVVANCIVLRNHLALRDLLRSDAELRDEYEAVKIALAREFDDIDDYTVAKSNVLRRLLGIAGLSAHDLYEIEAADRGALDGAKSQDS